MMQENFKQILVRRYDDGRILYEGSRVGRKFEWTYNREGRRLMSKKDFIKKYGQDRYNIFDTKQNFYCHEIDVNEF